MRGFNVFDPELPLPQHTFLEASAGTGKTFAIEHLVTRILLNEQGPELKEILIVTFTKAAAAELKQRIRNTLESALVSLDAETPSFPYLASILDKHSVKRRLRRILSIFDEAEIFTIHGFCFRALQQNGLEGMFLEEKESASPDAVKAILKDFFRTGLCPEKFGAEQIDKLLASHLYDIQSVVLRLAQLIERGLPIIAGRDYQESSDLFNAFIKRWKENVHLENLEEDFFNIAPCFKDLCDRQRNVKAEFKIQLKKFLTLFESPCDTLSRFPLFFEPEKRLKRPFPRVHHPDFFQQMQETLLPIVKEAFDPSSIEGRLAEEGRIWLKEQLKHQKILFYDDLVQAVKEKLADSEFVNKLRANYKVVMIDEFQDTDPKQWSIFSTLFLSVDFKGALYIVGDPKQSIYRFRNSDLYTYLKAKHAFSEKACFSLDCNYRSTAPLVEATNYLLSGAEHLFPLPKLGQVLSYPPVKAGSKQMWEVQDGKKSVHVCFGEGEKDFYPFMAEEILRLHHDCHIPFDGCAILVKDRFQAERISSYFHKLNIPTALKRNRQLTDSIAFSAFKEFLRAVMDLEDENALKLTLGGPLFQWSLEELFEIDAATFELFHHFQKVLLEKGVLSLFYALMEKRKCSLFSQPQGSFVYEDLLQIVEMLAEKWLPAEELLSFLDKIEAESESDRLKARQCETEAVQILTIHTSKGLEFDIVFPIGLIAPSSDRRDFFRDDENEVLTLTEQMQTLQKEESEAEKLRQFYVAVTRAKKRLYFPVISDEKSILHLYLKRLEKSKTFEEFIASCPEISSEKMLQKAASSFSQKTSLLHPPSKPELVFAPYFLSSFSSLAKHEEPERFFEKKGMPSGPQIGHLLHHLFEIYPFEEASTASSAKDFLPLVSSALHSTCLQGWEKEVCQILYNAFHTPLSKPDGFCLAEVSAKNIQKEMEFLYPTPQGMMKGFVDLFFEHKGKFYFIDWKSNDLGENYDKSTLESAMRQNDYYLQADIYSTALKKYLCLFSLEEKWGGGFYVFLRGLPNGIVEV